MTALAHGVPVLCIPLGRDQFFNAARVQALSAGATLSAAASADEIAAATRSLLVDDHARAGARTMALAIANHSNGRSAAAEIEQVIDASTSAVPAA